MKTKRLEAGQSLVELSAGLLVAIPILLALLDCGIIAIAVAANDLVCRDAARAAASGPPGIRVAGARSVPGGAPPAVRARQVLEKVYNLGLPVKMRDDLLQVSEVVSAVPQPNVGGSINGTVTVSSTIDVYPPFLIGAVTHGKIAFSSRHAFPYTYTEPAVASDF